MKIRLFGAITVDDMPIRGKPALLLAFLCLHRGMEVEREKLVDILWEDRPEDHLRLIARRISSLHTKLEIEVRKGPDKAGLDLPAGIELDARDIDGYEQTARAADARNEWGAALDAYEAFLAVVDKGFLDEATRRGAGVEAREWLEGVDRDFAGRQREALERAAHSALKIGTTPMLQRARSYVRQLVGDDESPNVALFLRLLIALQSGDHEEFEAIFQAARAACCETQAMDPRAVKLHDQWLRESPIPPGRVQQVEALVDAVLDQERRPVLVYGEPGVGKSSVASACLDDRRVKARFGESPPWVACDGLAHRHDLAAAIALSLSGDDVVNPEARLATPSESRSRPTLLILDGLDVPWREDQTGTVELLEHHLDSMPQLAVVCVMSGPKQRLRGGWHSGSFEVGKLDHEAARALFLRVAGRKFDDDLGLKGLIERLDGLTLAIRLMGGVARCSQGDIAAMRLQGEERLGVAECVKRAVDVASKTPGAVRLFELLGQLPNGLCLADVDPLLLAATPRDDANLAAGSLTDVELAVADGSRLRLRTSVRVHAERSCRPAVEDAAVASTHYRGLVLWHGPRVGRSDSQRDTRKLVEESANIQWAIRFALEHDPAAGIEATLALQTLAWFAAVSLDKLAERALLAATDDLQRADIRHARGLSALSRSRIDAASDDFEKAHELCRGLDRHRRATAELDLAEVALRRFHHDRAVTLFERALEHYDGDRLGRANSILGLGQGSLWRFDLAGAYKQFTKAGALYGEAEDGEVLDVLGKANCIKGLGDVAMGQGDLECARQRFLAAHELYGDVCYLLGQAHCLRHLGRIAFDDGTDKAGARERLREAQDRYHGLANRLGQANCAFDLAAIAQDESDDRAACELLAGAQNLYRQVNCVAGEVSCLHVRAEIARAKGSPERGREILNQAARTREPLWAGRAHLALARLQKDPAEPPLHLDRARTEWSRLDRADLLRALEPPYDLPPAPRIPDDNC